jgi:hypothetical protein
MVKPGQTHSKGQLMMLNARFLLGTLLILAGVTACVFKGGKHTRKAYGFRTYHAAEIALYCKSACTFDPASAPIRTISFCFLVLMWVKSRRSFAP